MFVSRSARQLGASLVLLTLGLDLWELARKKRAIPNTRMGFCSQMLKRDLLDGWREANAPGSTVYVGFDWMEEDRLERMRARLPDVRVEAPLTWRPRVDHDDAVRETQSDGLPLPMVYKLGLPHNNCLRYGCVKGGLAYWARLLEVLPDSYARSEKAEGELIQFLDRPCAILQDRTGGDTKPMTLKQFRERIQSAPRQATLFDQDDWGGLRLLHGRRIAAINWPFSYSSSSQGIVTSIDTPWS